MESQSVAPGTRDHGHGAPDHLALGAQRRSPVFAMLRFWPLSVLLVVAASGLGLVAAEAQTSTYTAEARVAVGYGDLAAGAIAGFPTAARELASNYARYVNDRGIQGEASTAAQDGVALSASPIPESNVVRIEGLSSDPESAVASVRRTAEALIDVVNDSSSVDPASLLSEYENLARDAAEAATMQDEAQRDLNRALSAPGTSQSRINTLTAEVVASRTAAASADLRSRAVEARYLNSGTISDAADLILVNDGTLVGNDATSRRQRYLLLGLFVGLAAAMAVSTVLERRGPQRRRAA